MNYKVKKGDTLSQIAKNYGISLDELIKLNAFSKDQANNLRIGQEIKLSDKSHMPQYTVSSVLTPKTSSYKPTSITPFKNNKEYIRSVQEQLIAEKFNLGKWGADGVWGKASQAALDKALAAGYTLVKGRLAKPASSAKPELTPKSSVRRVFESMSDMSLGPMGAYSTFYTVDPAERPKNNINPFRRPNKVLSKKPASINNQRIEHCAQYGNCVLRDKGYISNGHAWTRHGNQKTIYSGYNVANRPKTYDRDAVVKYNLEAANNVVNNFDFNTLDKNSVYTVGMFYKGSPAQEQAYNEGVGGVANTHTGNLFWNPETNSWVVEHNIHGTAYTNEVRDVIGTRGAYGITGIYKPYKAKGLGHAAALITGAFK